MITLHFGGWFQCRLATDPDPHDERRGVSGYVHAYGGEPDLDRIIHWQPPSFVRPEAPTPGVVVRRITLDDIEPAGHPLVGAQVSLLDEPKFEGRNGVIADDGEEPVYPFRLRVTAAPIVLQRSVVPSDPEFPYPEFFSSGVQAGPDVAADIAAVTGISDLRQAWRRRLQSLQARLPDAAGATRVGLLERIDVLSRWLSAPRGPAGFFGVRMTYDYALRSAPIVDGWTEPLGPAPARDAEWRAKFWLGGWDADALCGFCQGVLEIPHESTVPSAVVGMRADDRDALMTRRR